MAAVLLALGASFFIGLSTVLVKKVANRTSPTTVMIAVTLVGACFFWTLAARAFPYDRLLSKPILIFALAGLISPAVVRWLFFVSIDRVGAAMSSSILATGPAVAAFLAVIALGEALHPLMAVGLAATIGGIFILHKAQSPRETQRGYRRSVLLFPIGSAVLFGLAIVLRKQGLNIMDRPLVGVTIGFTLSLMLYAAVFAASERFRRSVVFKTADLPWLAGAGLFLGLAWLFIFHALSHGDVVLVAPLSNLHPLVVVGLGSIVLGREETMTVRTALGATVVVGGAIMVTLGGI